MLRVGLGEYAAKQLLMLDRFVGRADREPERVRDQAGERGLDEARDFGDLGDADAGEAGLVASALEQTDRLLADRSSGHQQHEVDRVRDQLTRHHRRALADEAHGIWHIPHPRIRRGGERSDHAALSHTRKRCEREDNVDILACTARVITGMSEHHTRLGCARGDPTKGIIPASPRAKRSSRVRCAPAVETSATRARVSATIGSVRGEGSANRCQWKPGKPSRTERSSNSTQARDMAQQ